MTITTFLTINSHKILENKANISNNFFDILFGFRDIGNQTFKLLESRNLITLVIVILKTKRCTEKNSLFCCVLSIFNPETQACVNFNVRKFFSDPNNIFYLQ